MDNDTLLQFIDQFMLDRYGLVPFIDEDPIEVFDPITVIHNPPTVTLRDITTETGLQSLESTSTAEEYVGRLSAVHVRKWGAKYSGTPQPVVIDLPSYAEHYKTRHIRVGNEAAILIDERMGIEDFIREWCGFRVSEFIWKSDYPVIGLGEQHDGIEEPLVTVFIEMDSFPDTFRWDQETDTTIHNWIRTLGDVDRIILIGDDTWAFTAILDREREVLE